MSQAKPPLDASPARPGQREPDPERQVDWFLPLVAALGLGLVAALVYIYWP